MTINTSERIFFDKIAQEASISPPKPLSDQTIAEFRAGAGIFAEYTGSPADVSHEGQFISARDGYQIRPFCQMAVISIGHV